MISPQEKVLRTSLRLFAASALVIALTVLSGCGMRKVQTVEEETEANRILDVLLANGITASKVEVGDGQKRVFEIQISGGEDEFRAAIQLMDDHCLPQPVPPEIESSGLVSSLEVEKARQLRRIKINIESQLRNFPGATCVDVNLVQPEDKSLSLNPYPASATVLIKFKGEKFGLNTNQVARMVAGAVPGLSADKVFVTLTRAPLRPLPNIDRGRNLRRILLVTGVGFATILSFVALAVFMRRRASRNRIDRSNELTRGDLEEMTPEELEDLGLNQSEIESGTSDEG